MKKSDKDTDKKNLESKKKIVEEKKKIKEEKAKNKEKKKTVKKDKKESKISKKKNILKSKNNENLTFFTRIRTFFNDDRDTYSFGELFIVTLISLVVGAFACFSVLTIFTGNRNYFKLSKELDKFFDVYETLVDNYYDNIDKDALVEAAIDGMVSSVGDDYTNYVDIENTDDFDELVNGIYEGIGCTIQLKDAGLTIIEVFEGSPSEKTGLQVNDVILKVDDIDVVSTTDIDELANYIKNESSEKIIMVVSRNGEKITFEINREKVEMPVVTSKIYEKNGKKIGYVNISIFSSVASKQFKTKIEELENKNIEGLVIDVRGNSGGYLTTVKDITSQLLPKGNVIYQVEKDDEKEISRDKTTECRSYPIAVLINGSSASASEILAAAIKESYGGFVVGTTSYGKGTVQQIKKLSDGSMIKYTVENWLTPNGNWIDEIGIEPTNVVKMNSNYYDKPVVENDNQLQEALSLVSK